MDQEKEILVKLVSSYQDEIRQKEKQLYNKDLYKFNTEVIGFPDVTDPPHRELCEFVEDTSKYRKKLILMPRGHLKSSAVTVAYTIQQIVNDPKIRILIVSGTYQLAVNFLMQIKKTLMRNGKIRKLYGDLSKNAPLWRGDSIMVAALNDEDRPVNEIKDKMDYETKEPTVLAMGVDGGLTSTHFDIIILDDVVTRENIGTIDQIRKVIMFYRDMQDIWDRSHPNAQIIVIGTRWHDGDLYGWLQDHDNPESKQMGVMIRQAVHNPKIVVNRSGVGYRLDNTEEDVLFKKKFSIPTLQELLDSKGPYEFTTQYLNKIMDDETAKFKREWMHRYDPQDMEGRLLNKYILVDPAISQEETADYTAMVVVGIDTFQKVFVLEVVRDRLTPMEIIDTLFVLDERWKPKSVGIETVAFQKALQAFMRTEFERRNRSIPMTELKTDSRESKKMRIEGLQPYYARGDVYHPINTKNIDYLEDELIRFPYSKNDDIIDALAYFPQLVVKPKAKERSEHHGYLY